jgi:hypothetical protein
MSRRVTCTSCGYTTTPVSGFCPRCLEHLPVGRRRARDLPFFAAGVLGVLALAAALAATLGSSELGRLSVQAEPTRAPASSPTDIAQPATPDPSASKEPASPAPSARVPPATAVAQAVGSPEPSPSSAPAPPAVVLPSTSTDYDVHPRPRAHVASSTATPFRKAVRAWADTTFHAKRDRRSNRCESEIARWSRLPSSRRQNGPVPG